MDTEETEATENPEEFGRGYYLFFGALGALFVAVALALTVVIAYPLFVDYFAYPADTATGTTAPGTDEGGGGGGTAGDSARGEQIANTTCSACHGPTLEGVAGLGPSLVGSQFVAGLGDDELLAFISTGRPADDPNNTTGVAMPPKGGNPSLSDEDLQDVIAYLRELG